MQRARPRSARFAVAVAAAVCLALPVHAQIGVEVAVPRHLQDGEELTVGALPLIAHGRQLFVANWTGQEGGGRPLTKGNGNPLADPSDPLVFPRNFNRVSAPDANSCAGCHNLPIAGGAGDIVANVFVLGQRFDFATFDPEDVIPTRGTLLENGDPALLDNIANGRATTSMAGAGYLEMLARQMTADLQRTRDSLGPGQSAPLRSKGIGFGNLSRRADGTWDLASVEGLAAPSVRSTGAGDPPSLIVRPWHQASAVVSLREFSNNAFNHHHGIQSTERFGDGTDPDGDGFLDEMTRADVTAVSVWQATLPVPGRVIPRDNAVERAILLGEARFESIGCARCHVSALPLTHGGWFFVEPNPYNPPGNARPGEVPELKIDLNARWLPGPRLRRTPDNVTWVPAYTDMKLHDITSGPDDPNREPLNMHFAPSSNEFFAGNSRFLTKRLWGAASEPPFFHHGKFTTMRQAILAHSGEALAERQAFEALPAGERDAVVEFLKSLQMLPPGTPHLVIDDLGRPRQWPPTQGG